MLLLTKLDMRDELIAELEVLELELDVNLTRIEECTFEEEKGTWLLDALNFSIDLELDSFEELSFEDERRMLLDDMFSLVELEEDLDFMGLDELNSGDGKTLSRLEELCA